jgi:hypothetical protein
MAFNIDHLLLICWQVPEINSLKNTVYNIKDSCWLHLAHIEEQLFGELSLQRVAFGLVWEFGWLYVHFVQYIYS